MTIEGFIAHVGSAKQTGRGWIFRCPAHADRHPSAAASVGADERILLKCWAGCTAQEITGALGLKLADLFPDTTPSREEITRARREREAKAAAEKARRHKEGLVIDACREAEGFVRSRVGVDISTWGDKRLDGELNDLAAAYSLLWTEDVYGSR